MSHTQSLPQITEFIPQLVRAGLVGLEVYYSNYTEAEKRFLEAQARKHNLIATGGSDYHGPGITASPPPGQVDVPWSAVEQLQAYTPQMAGIG